jgi:ATP-binding cassette subfamily F protein 3
MVSVRNISISFGSFDLLSDVSFLINNQDRIGLAGKNGAGKSTLLKIIAGLQGSSSGQIDLPRDFTMGYLPQQMKVNDTTTVLNEAISAFSEIRGLAEEIEICHLELNHRTDYETSEYLKLCDHLTIIEERYRMMGGTNYLAEAEKTLLGLGFERTDFERHPSSFLMNRLITLILNPFSGLKHFFQGIREQSFLSRMTGLFLIL